ncbi:MAG: hypothetical protein A2086_09480 [Spirochaetes bacterium GWD1_27_9]|nr:MAG: hypothetical protein A2Z98_06040 [Spirochaetes bacterium GWB1_27_13]OHD25022.1 MAG: hypothetical protein A2Y34_03080 [Spirochaetes bacterium GWC1_27_15]OHD29726.1 MAG: hypothetical protein A2086_09480 [Spirochaetes bacterium GWD1_27_9]
MKNRFLFVLKLIRIFFAIFLTILSFSCAKKVERKILYYVSPMDPQVKSDKPQKDSMGMDFIPVYENDDKKDQKKVEKKILYYVNPMDPSIKSDKPQKDSMGMDFVPIYEGEENKINISDNSDVISSVTLSKDDEQKISLQTTKIMFKKIERSTKSVGKISFNEQQWVHVSARFGGRIDKLNVNFTGMKVYKNQTLMSIYSPSLVTAQEELLQVYKDYSSSISNNNQSLTKLSKSLFDSTKNKLKLWGITEEQIVEILKNGEPFINVPIISPITGTVIKMYVNAGMYIEEGEMLYEIANLDKVWMEADIYEQDISGIKEGIDVAVTSISYPGTVFEGKISFVSPYLEPTTRTVKIRADFDNKEGLLKPGMYVDATVLVPLEDEFLTIPVTAVLDTGKRKIAYVALGGGKYEGRNVTLGPKMGDIYPVISGLAEGENVVTYGVYLIDSQSQISGTSLIKYSDE